MFNVKNIILIFLLKSIHTNWNFENKCMLSLNWIAKNLWKITERLYSHKTHLKFMKSSSSKWYNNNCCGLFLSVLMFRNNNEYFVKITIKIHYTDLSFYSYIVIVNDIYLASCIDYWVHSWLICCQYTKCVALLWFR